MASRASGWARPACAAIVAMWWSTASIRHDREHKRDRRPAPPLSLDGDVDLLPRPRHNLDLLGDHGLVEQLLALRGCRRPAAGRPELADRPPAVRAGPALPRRRAGV